jgi:hypothetical protein
MSGRTVVRIFRQRSGWVFALLMSASWKRHAPPLAGLKFMRRTISRVRRLPVSNHSGATIP